MLICLHIYIYTHYVDMSIYIYIHIMLMYIYIYIMLYNMYISNIYISLYIYIHMYTCTYTDCKDSHSGMDDHTTQTPSFDHGTPIAYGYGQSSHSEWCIEKGVDICYISTYLLILIVFCQRFLQSTLIYSLVIFYIALENHHFSWEN